jgi:hypothetical protein
MNGMKTSIYGIIFGLIIIVFGGITPLLGAQTRSAPIDVNLIIDGSESLSAVKEEVTAWVSRNFIDQVLAEGDNITVWSAGFAAKVIFSGKISGNSDKEGLKKNIREIAASGKTADFTDALKEAVLRRQNSQFSYTLLISASPEALAPVFSGGQASLARFSRVEEFSGWRALVVGLNLEEKVERAAAAFLDSCQAKHEKIILKFFNCHRNDLHPCHCGFGHRLLETVLLSKDARDAKNQNRHAQGHRHDYGFWNSGANNMGRKPKYEHCHGRRGNRPCSAKHRG